MNAANAELAGGGGVDGAIHRAAGPSVMSELRGKYTGCPTGSAVITGAGELAAQHIIHAVGPVWRGGTHGEAEDLASAFRTSLDLAQAANASSIAFPAISCGVYGYPVEKAAPVSVGAVRDWLAEHPDTSLRRVTFVRARRRDGERVRPGDRRRRVGTAQLSMAEAKGQASGRGLGPVRLRDHRLGRRG